MFIVVGQPEMRQEPPFVVPLIDWLHKVCARSKNAFVNNNLMEKTGVNDLVQFVWVKRVDNGQCATPDGGPVVAQRCQIDAGTEVRDLLICHCGPAVTDGHIQTRHPLLVVEDLWPVPY